MPTYFQPTDDEGGRRATSLGMPAPEHALTKGAKRARRAVRALADDRRTRVTRADVEAAYVHPAPEVEAEVVYKSGQRFGPVSLYASGAKSLVALAERNGHRVRATYNRGTTLPKWHVNAPDNKINPGPPVGASQYHGEVVDCETVYVVAYSRSTPKTYQQHRIRGVWIDGKLDHIEVDGQPSTLKAAREVLS